MGATGGMHADSDIDLFVVRPGGIEPDDPDWRSQLDTLSQHCSNWTGNDARILEYSDAEVIRALSTGDAVLSDIALQGQRVVGQADYLRPSRSRTL